MIYFIRKIIRAFVAPEHNISCRRSLWDEGIKELRRRTEGCHESGAFLLGERDNDRCRIVKFVYYDDLDPHSLDTGIVVFDGSGYGPLWELCRETGLTVVADVHVHPCEARQSESDRQNPMIANKGHVALIVPNFAAGRASPAELGIYEYQGRHRWTNHSGDGAENFFYAGFWG